MHSTLYHAFMVLMIVNELAVIWGIEWNAGKAR